MNWDDYEEITKYIYETLGRDSGVKIKCYGNNCKVEGKSGVKHQVDVLTEFSDGVHSYKTAVECKYWNKKINKDIVMKIESILDDSNINKGVVVSKKGFTPDAIQYAKFRNIGLIELREITDKDWEGRIQKIKLHTQLIIPSISLNLLYPENTSENLRSNVENTENLVIIKQDKSIIEFKDLFNKFHDELSKLKIGVPLKKSYKLDTNSIFKDKNTGEIYDIVAFELNGILVSEEAKTTYDGKDYVWMIMKSIFEEKTHLITKDKEIKERTN